MAASTTSPARFAPAGSAWGDRRRGPVEPFRSPAALKGLQAEAGVLVGTTPALPPPPATTEGTREFFM
jgi:hypothetical protein